MHKPILFFFFCCASLQAQSANMLVNGQFRQGMEGWEWRRASEYKDKASPPMIVPARGPKDLPSCVQKVPHRSAWHYLRIQQAVAIQNGETYKVALDLKSRTKEGLVRISTWSHNQQKNNGLSMALEITPAWKRFEVRFRARNVVDDEIPAFSIGFGDLVDSISVRNVSFQQISDPELKGQAKNEIALEKPSSRPPIETVQVQVDEMIDAFSEDLDAAKRTYVGKNLALTASITKVEKGRRPGTYTLSLQRGKVKVFAGGSAFTDRHYEQLSEKLKNVRRVIKSDETRNERDWERLDKDARAAKELTFYPVLDCIARISNYRNRVIEIEKTMGLTVGF